MRNKRAKALRAYARTHATKFDSEPTPMQVRSKRGTLLRQSYMWAPGTFRRIYQDLKRADRLVAR